MLKNIIPSLILLVLSLISIKPALADTVGLYIGAGVWKHSPSGTLNYLGTDTDLETGLKFDDETESFGYIRIEHPVPLIPNLLLSRYALGHTGSGTVAAGGDFTFGGTTYTSGTNISTELNLDSTDVILYYELWDTILGVDFGFGAKAISGKAEVISGGVTNTHSIDSTQPLAYAQISLAIPGTGLSISAEGRHNILQDSDICDYNYKITYETDYFLGIEGGFREAKIKLKNLDTVDSGMAFAGPFVNLLLHF